VRSRHIVSDLAYPPAVARNFPDYFEIPRLQKHKSVLAWFHLQGQMVNQVGDASERRWLVTADSSQRFTRLPDLMEEATFANDL
jgi:hypothetical protein